MAETASAKTGVRVAVDAVGGDYAPEEVVLGAVEAARNGVTILLVGPPERVQPALDRLDLSALPVRLIPSDEAIPETEQPALELRRRPQASVAVATALVQRGEADAVVSMGSTGAAMVAAVQLLGVMEGIERPVLGGPFMGFAPQTVGIDMGTNVDCKPAQFLDFAAIGAVFCREYLDIENPTVALLNLGVEEGKGNRQTREAYALLKRSGLNFVGNIEPYGLLAGKANVVLWDGFVGNILLKFCEGMGVVAAGYMQEQLAGEVAAGRLEALAQGLFEKTNITESFGAPLWGVNGVSVLGHGRAHARQVGAAIKTAQLLVERDLVGAIREELARVRATVRA